MNRKKPILLIILCFIFMSSTHISIAMDDNAQGPLNELSMENIKKLMLNLQGNWKTKLLWLIAPVLLQVILKEFATLFARKIYGNEFTERAKIRSLIKINQALKNQLDYIKKNYKSSPLIRDMEKKYLESSIKIMELQKKYLDTYEKK